MIMYRSISRNRFGSVRSACVLLMILCSATFAPADDDDPASGEASAPDNMTPISTTLGGAYFVDKALIQRSDALKTQLRMIRGQIEKGDISSDAASKRLASITVELTLIRSEIQEEKVLVQAFNVYTKTEETVIPLDDTRRVIITADAAQVRGWHGPGIKCVLEKTIVAKQQPDDDEFAAIKVEHQLRVAEDLVGETRLKRDLREREYMASEKGQSMTPAQLAARQERLNEVIGSKLKYEPFQGKLCHTLAVGGLDRKYLSVKLQSSGGTTTHSSRRQMHAKLTVFVPTLDHLCVRGCLVSLDIADIKCDLILTTDGSRDRDYEGSFVVENVNGNVLIDQAPVRQLTRVSGDIDVTMTDEFVNGGTHHEGETRTASFFETEPTTISGVGGDLRAWFLRTTLTVSRVKGAIDIRNDYGDTSWTLDGTLDASSAHRILSDSGVISLVGDVGLVKRTPIHAYTLCGTLHTNLHREVLDDVDFTTGWPRRSWAGFVTQSEDRFSIAKFERPARVMENSKRTPGVDLISKAGSIRIMAED